MLVGKLDSKITRSRYHSLTLLCAAFVRPFMSLFDEIAIFRYFVLCLRVVLRCVAVIFVPVVIWYCVLSSAPCAAPGPQTSKFTNQHGLHRPRALRCPSFGGLTCRVVACSYTKHDRTKSKLVCLERITVLAFMAESLVRDSTETNSSTKCQKSRASQKSSTECE